MDKLSHVLNDMGFFSALGTSEHPGCCPKEVYVKVGTPNTHDSNNGVVVVYDERGRPWIVKTMSGEAAEKFDEVIEKYGLKRGAYTLHSNDGGGFVNIVMPTLFN